MNDNEYLTKLVNDSRETVSAPPVSRHPILWCALMCWLTATIIIAAIAFSNRTTYSPIKEAPAEPTPMPVARPAPTPIVLRPSPTPAIAQQQSLTLPESGELRTFAEVTRVASLEIKTLPGQNHLVRLYSAGRLILSVFVRGGETTKVQVPLGTFVLKFASGSEWYGYWHLFGPSTTYTKIDEPFTFQRGYEWYVTLYTVANGNMHLSRIAANEF
jgi:hypothetical protein